MLYYTVSKNAYNPIIVKIVIFVNGKDRFYLKRMKKVTKMTSLKKEKKLITSMFVRCFPILFTLIIFFLFPPVAIAIILAFLTSPLLNTVRAVTKLPLTLSTLVVIIFICLMSFSFFYIGLYGLIEMIPSVEKHLSSIHPNIDYMSQLISFLEESIVTYGQAILDYAFTMIQTIIQQFINLVIFFVAYFFALRESGKSRFWFLIYFPARFRAQARRNLDKASELFSTFLAVEIKLIFITFLILALGFFILKFSFPLGLAFIISLVDSLPFLGIGLFLIPMIAFFLYIGDIWTGIFLICIYIVVATTRQFAESYMWASAFQLKPIHTFIILACAVYTFGFIGVLLAPFLLFAAFRVKHHPSFTE